MLGDIDVLDFLVAETTGRTLAEVRALPQAEVTEWKAFYTYRAAMEQFHRDEAASREG